MNIDWTAIIAGLLGVIGGGVGSYFSFRTNQSSNFREDFKELVDNLQAKVEKLEQREDSYINRIKELENEVSLLKNKLVLVQAAQLDMPIPQWIKDTKGTMLALNVSYEDTFLTPVNKTSADYIGKTDEQVWGEQIAEHYSKADRLVLRSRKVWQGEEVVDFGSHKEDWLIMKYPIYSGNLIIGVAGIAFKRSEKQDHE